MFQEFRIKCQILQQDSQNFKLNPKSQEFIFVGLSDHGKAWRYQNLHSYQIQISQNVIFKNQTHEYHYIIPNPVSSNNTDTLNPLLLEREQEISKQILGSQPNPKLNSEPSETLKKANTNHLVQLLNAPLKSYIPKSALLSHEHSACIISQPLIDYCVFNNPQARNKPPGWKTVVLLSSNQKPTNKFVLLSNDSIISDKPLSYYKAIS